MKKVDFKIEYSTPEVKVIKMNVVKMICASDGSSSSAGLDEEEEEGDPT